MSKNQGAIVDVIFSAGAAAISCVLLNFVDFQPVYVFCTLVLARAGKLTLKRRVAGLHRHIAVQRGRK